MFTTREMLIEGHKLVAVSFNEDKPGHPIILLHGITSSVDSWISDELNLFTERGPCYALSLPGHYPATFPVDFQPGSLTVELIVHLLTAGIRNLVGNQPVILVGHSTGGFAALAIAAYTPDIARCVVSISGFAQGQWIGMLGVCQQLVRYGFIGKLLFKLTYKLNRCFRAGFRASLRLYTADSSRFTDYPHLETFIDNFLPNYRRLDLDAMVHYFTVMPNIDIISLLPNITAPTLVLTGDRDPIVPPAQAGLIAGEISCSNLEIMIGVGHLLMLEDRIQYQRIVRDWLNQLL